MEANRDISREILQILPDATFAIDTDGCVILWNKAMEDITGILAEEVMGKGDQIYSIPFYGETRKQLIDLILEDSAEIELLYPYILREGDTLATEVHCKALYRKKGAWVFAKASPICDQSGNILGAIESIRDVSDKKFMEERLKKSVAWFEAIVNATSDSVMLVKPDGTILYLNENAARRRAVVKDIMLGQNLFDFLPQKAAHTRHKAFDEILLERRLIQYEETRNDRHYRIRLFPVMDDQGKVIQIAGFSRDITESKCFEKEKMKLQTQLHQAQKMESVGQLAGGVAHDFNNMLGIILGSAELALGKVAPSEPLHHDLRRIVDAGNRSADIVRQLLGFARKQNIDPKILNINENIAGMLGMLQSLVGESMDLAWFPKTEMHAVRMDPTQLHQVLVNLCVNARDALAGKGRITIATDMVTFDAAYCGTHLGFIPGEFALLTVSDDGCGIDKKILDKIFEPFFTTKEVGKGTGLGLATIYGIVKQNKGFINVYSELGQGTTFKIYLPVYRGATRQVQKEAKGRISTGNGETILLVEDDAALLKISKTMLESLGYQVLIADTPVEALRLVREYVDDIHVLITDVIMPGMNGRELADLIHTARPAIKTLFMSGYTADIIAHRGMLDEGRCFVQKPFSIEGLAIKVHEALATSQ